MTKNKKNTQLPTVELEEKTKQSLANTESTTNSIYEDLSDIGNEVDISKMNLEQIKEEIKKLRREHDQFKWEIKKFIAMEIEKYIQPLVDQLNKFTETKTKVVYLKQMKLPSLSVSPVLDFFKGIYARIKKWKNPHGIL